jgi:hypothetical protein
MTDIFKGDVEDAYILGNVEQGTEFSFSCGGHDVLENDTGDMDCTIGLGRIGEVMLAAEVENAAGAITRLGLGEIRRVAVDGEVIGLVEIRTLASG